jgi:hypothetical protein
VELIDDFLNDDGVSSCNIETSNAANKVTLEAANDAPMVNWNMIQALPGNIIRARSCHSAMLERKQLLCCLPTDSPHLPSTYTQQHRLVTLAIAGIYFNGITTVIILMVR